MERSSPAPPSGTNPTPLRTTDLPTTSAPDELSSAAASKSSSSTPSVMNSRLFAPIRAYTAPTSRSPSSSSPSSSSRFPTSSTRSSTSDDSLWSASLSRYSFCSSNSQSSSRSTSRHGSPRKEREKRLQRSDTTPTMRCGRHGDEWLFNGWADVVRSIWK